MQRTNSSSSRHSRHSGSNTSQSPGRKKRGSTLSMASQSARKSMNRQAAREEQIAKRISETFRDRELKMYQAITQTIWDDKCKMYKQFRKDHEHKLHELEKDRSKILRRKKNKKEKQRALKKNTIERVYIICTVVKLTVQHYKKLYFESDHYRHMKLLEIQTGDRNKQDKARQAQAPPAQPPPEEPKDSNEIERTGAPDAPPASFVPPIYQGKKFIGQLSKFFDSPFRDDKRFAVQYMAQLTRDRIHESEEAVNALFYDRIFRILEEGKSKDKDEVNRLKSFEVLSNMVQSDAQRHKLANNEYFARVFDKAQAVADSKDSADTRILERLSWLVTLISFHQDMFPHIIKLNLLQFILKIADAKYPSAVRSNAVLAISLLTYNEMLFEEIIEKGVIDLIMQLCRDQDQDLEVKQFSTLALVHFALSKKSINILIGKGVLDLFDTFGSNQSDSKNVIIQTNVSWIFLALCNNGITGARMLTQGITRDMFLVSCNPEYQQIRHLVITGFAELGRCTDQQKSNEQYSLDKQRIKETAIVGMYEHLVSNAQQNIDILLHFSASDDLKFQYTAFWALKDYILLTHDNLIPDISDVIQAFLNGCLSEETKIQAECANAISFLVTHHLVYKSHLTPGMSEQMVKEILEKIHNSSVEYILDAIMYLSGNDSKFIRTTAFSTLSSLSKYSSQCKSVMGQIQRDIEIPEDLTSKNYLGFVRDRLAQQKDIFFAKFKNDLIEREFSGLYSLLRLAQEPCDEEIEDASNKYIDFVETEYDPENVQHVQNENYFIKVFVALKHSRNPSILKKLLKVIKFYIDQDNSDCQKEVINPDTILWMLEIMEHQRTEKYLCCLTSSTLLSIVKKHEIPFDYQEVAIIKKFNMALQNIDVFDQEDDHRRDATNKTGANGSKEEVENRLVKNERSDLGAKEQLGGESGERIQEMGGGQGSSDPNGSRGGRSGAGPGRGYPDYGEEIDNKAGDPSVAQQDIEGPERTWQNKKASQSGPESSGIEVNNTDRKDEMKNELSEQDTPVRKSDRYSPSINQREADESGSQRASRIRPPSSEASQEAYKTAKRKLSQDIVRASDKEAQEDQKLQPHQEGYEDHKEDMVNSGAAEEQRSSGIGRDTEESRRLGSSKASIQQASKHGGSGYDGRVGGDLNPGQQQPSPEADSPSGIELKTKTKKSTNKPSIPESNDKKHSSIPLQGPAKPESTATGLERPSSRRVGGGNKQQSASRILKSQQTPDLNEEGKSVDTEQYEAVNIEDIDPDDHELVEIHLRDSLIKAFMVIFTNDKSQHLLLNKDLIDIAFNRLEFCNDCTLEAKKHVARLISIIFKFPQVQERLIGYMVEARLQLKKQCGGDIVAGMCELLRQKKHTDIIRYTIKACTYISMNYDFIKQSIFSLDILKAMMTLLDQMTSRDDRYNIILTIKNILKGDKENKRYFLENGGTQKFTDIILASSDLQLIEMCIQGIAEQASYKKFMVKILSIPEATSQLKQIIKKCLDITEDWHHDVNLKDFENAKKQALAGSGLAGNRDAPSAGDMPNPGRSEDLGTELSEESKFSYSVDESNIQIPEFMKNDLEQLNLGDKGGENQMKYEEEFKVTRLGKIRNSTYYVVARAIKFGLEASYLLYECQLTQKIIKDLSLQNENNFIFQNLLLIVSNLQLESQAIVDLIGNNYEAIIDQIYETKDKDRRVSLLKVLINLILEASEQLSPNSMLFQKVFEIAKDHRSDESMIENVLWLATSLCEQNQFNKNFHLVIEHMVQNQIMLIIWKSLCSKQERIILQALKLLTRLGDEEELRSQLFQQKEIFKQIKGISSSTDQYKSYQVEIQTALCKCLDKITQVENPTGVGVGSNAMNLQQMDQIKIFNKYLINLALQKEYIIKRLDEEEAVDEGQDGDRLAGMNMDVLGPSLELGLEEAAGIGQRQGGEAAFKPGSTAYGDNSPTKMPLGEREGRQDLQGQSALLGEPVLDDIERLANCNEMVENIVCTLSNISNDFSLHHELIANGLIDVIRKYIELFLAEARKGNRYGVDEVVEGIDLAVMPTGALQLIKAITVIIANLSGNSQTSMQCSSLGLLQLIMNCLKLRDYEVLTHLYKSLGNFLTSGDQEIRRKAVYQGCLQEMLQAHEMSPFFRIRRICTEYLNQIAQFDVEMFEINDTMQLRQQREQEMLQRQQYMMANGGGQDYALHQPPGAM